MLRQPIRAPSPPPGFPHKSLTATGLTHIVNTSTQEVTMRLLLGLFSALLLAFCASLVANQRPQPNSCHFTIQGTPAQPQISGPPDLVPLGYGGISGTGAFNAASILPGHTAELIASTGGTGNVQSNPMKILISVDAIAFDDCAFRPSVRVPLSLGIKPSWLF